jgi:hypothetical protein
MIVNNLGNQKTQVCIVGSGLGGGTLALKLAEKGISFIIIEAGGLDNNSPNVTHESTGREFGLRSTRSIQLGGTSNLWHGVLSPLDEIDFKSREWIPGSGWPITFEDLNDFYQEASTLLGVKDYDYFTIDKLPDNLKDELGNVEFNQNILKNKMFQQPLPAKNFKEDLLQLVKDSNKYHLCLNSVALELVMDGGITTSLKIGKEDGSIFEIEADNFVISSGALETPRLLLNSNLNNTSIGKYLMDHPMANLCQIESKTKQKSHLYSAMKYAPNIAIKTGLELQDSIQEKLKLPNHNFYLRPSFTKGIDNKTEKIILSLLTFRDGGITLKDVWSVISNIKVIFQVVLYKFSLNPSHKYSDLWFVTEQIPHKDSNVTLADSCDKWGYSISRVNWKIADQDEKSMLQWYEILKNECFDGRQYLFNNQFKDTDWNENFTSAAHHVGTARMSDTEENGVVDKNLKVFGVDNLYVCDGSIFPTSGNVNCGLTISAFACRLANHLSANLNNG